MLEELAVNSDKALKPFAAVREHVANFIVESNKVAQASAKTRAALAQATSKLFPPFLEQLVPAVERLGRFAEADHPGLQGPRRRPRPASTKPSRTARLLAELDKFFKSIGADLEALRARRSWPPSRCWRG